jgi:PIF1-like helicase
MQHKIAIATASSGIAGTLLHKGITAHSRFKFPIPIFDDYICNIAVNSEKAKIIKNSAIIFLDEASMLHHFNIDALDWFLTVLMGNETIFGGKLLVICGDFRQILPLISAGRHADIFQACLKASKLWQYVTTLTLTINMRVQQALIEDPSDENRRYLEEYSQWLLSIGEGKDPVVHDGSIILLDDEISCKNPQQVFDEIYNNFEDELNNGDYFKDRAILSATNDTINAANEEMLRKIHQLSIHCRSIHTVVDADQAAAFNTEVLNGIEYSGPPQHHLHLKIGAPILLMRNLDVKSGHCNGTRYMIVNITQHLITAKCLETDEIILIPRIPSHTKNLAFEMK